MAIAKIGFGFTNEVLCKFEVHKLFINPSESNMILLKILFSKMSLKL